MPISYGPYFKLLYMKDAEDTRYFHSLFPPTNSAAVPQLFKLFLPNCSTVVVETEYIDTDYRACYSRLYYLRHADLPRRCTRLHFFNDVISADDLLDLPADKRKSYRGFVVLRPLPEFCLGRTLLSYKLIEEIIAKPNPMTSFYLTCAAQYSVNLAGNSIAFTGAPWIQQDTMVSACASAAIWVVSSHLSTKFGTEFKSYTTPAITDLATKTNIDGGRAMPSAGLTTQQIMFALREMGCGPVLYSSFDLSSYHEARKQLYYYVESGIPVILGLELAHGEGHAITVVGHALDLNSKPRPHDIGPIACCSSSDFIPAFIAQDDVAGPFRVLELCDWGLADLLGERRRRCVCPVKIGGHQDAFLRALIIPLPLDVTLRGDEAERRTMKSVAQWFRTSKTPDDVMVFRTFLEQSNSFKTRFLDGLPQELSVQLRRQLMPRWVWVTEVAGLAGYKQPRRHAIGHWVHDSAGIPKSKATSLDVVLWHMPGFFRALQPNGDPSVELVDYDSFPRYHRYSHDD